MTVVRIVKWYHWRRLPCPTKINHFEIVNQTTFHLNGPSEMSFFAFIQFCKSASNSKKIVFVFIEWNLFLSRNETNWHFCLFLYFYVCLHTINHLPLECQDLKAVRDPKNVLISFQIILKGNKSFCSRKFVLILDSLKECPIVYWYFFFKLSFS